MQITLNQISSIYKEDTKILKERLLIILSKQSYITGDFTLASGKKSNYYIDGKKTTLDAEGGLIISILFLRMLKENIDAVGGISVGADPLASGVSQIGYLFGKGINAFYVRKEPKKHGTSKWIEGPINSGIKVAILEDVVTTGGSSLKAIDIVSEFGCKVEQVLAVVDRNEVGINPFEEKGVQYNYLFKIDEVIQKSKE